MNANARKVHRTVVGFGMACAVAAALPCVAGDAAPGMDTVTVQADSIATPDKKPRKSAPAEENIGFFSGLAIGAVAGGPIGAVAGGITGALLGEHYHKQKLLNHTLAADLSGSNADKAKLTQAVMLLGGSLDHARDLTVNIAFRTGDSNLTAEDIDQLTTLGKLAGGIAGMQIQVSGYADPRGSEEYNQELSKERAEAVAAVLTNAGISQDHVVIAALGTNGASKTGNPDDYALQRRVSVKLIGTDAEDAKKSTLTVAQAQ
jgi:outer membrane protein OmpA-like peptidoglycan-associated protein